MKVSVCMIAYNHAPFIAQAVEGVLAQRTSFDFELVVGDDCSTDGTRAILERYAANDPRIRLLPREKNLGMMRNFWDVLRSCRGEYVAMLEGDDYWTDPTKLQRQADYLDAHADVALVFHGVVVLDEATGRTRRKPRFRLRKRASLQDLLRRGNFIHTASTMFRNREFGPAPQWILDLKIGDYVMHSLNAERGAIAYLPRTMSVYRMHGGGVHSGLPQAARIDLLIGVLDRLDEHFEYRYAAAISTHREYLLAVRDFWAGDVASAKTHARARFRVPPWNAQFITAGLILYAPGLYRLLRRLVAP